MKSILDIINDFNDGDFDFVKSAYGGIGTFFKVLKKKNLFHLIDPINGSNSEEWQNDYFLYLIENDLPRIQKIITDNFFTDVKFYNGEAYLELGDPSELAVLFCDDRNTNRDFIEAILKGDLYNSFDSVYIDNIYDDVIHPLGTDPEKFDYLKKYFVKELNSVEINPKTKLLSNIAEKQDADYVTVNETNIDEIFKDSKTVNFILEEYLDNLNSNLRSLYYDAYNNAYESEVYDDITDKLSYYFSDFMWDTRVNPKGNQISFYRCKIDDFWKTIKDILQKDSKYGRTLDYYRDYLTMLEENVECIRYYPPDYPDYKLVDKNVKDGFYEYV